MMTLREWREYIMLKNNERSDGLAPPLRLMALEYKHSATLLSFKLAELREELKACEDDQERLRLRHVIYLVSTSMTQTNELAELTERYYERGFSTPPAYSFRKQKKSAAPVKAADISGEGQELESFRGVAVGKETAEVAK